MAKRTVQLQQEVETEEEWEELVMKPGLIVVDVYSDWAGPCAGMSGVLRKIKLEQGGETLILAMARNDDIKCLRRFRNKSRPTWMFISNQRVVRLVGGCNAPSLTRIILDELNKTKAAIESKVPRTGIDYDQMTEEEQIIADKEREEQEEQERIENEERNRAINEHRELVVENLKESLNDYNFVVVWPHVKSDGLQQIMSAIKDLLVATVGKPVNYKFTENDIYEMFYYADWKYSEEELKEFCGEEVTALLFSLSGAEEGELVQMFLEKMYGYVKHPPGDENSLAVRLCKEKKIVKLHTPLEEPTPIPSETEARKSSVKSVKTSVAEPEPRVTEVVEKLPTLGSLTIPTMTTAEDIEIPADEEDVEIIYIPAIYVPENEYCKILAMRILFPAMTSKFDIPEPEPVPPHLIIAFDTTKNAEIMELAEQYPEETMHMGFFTSEKPEEARLVCKRVHNFERMAIKPDDARLVIQVSKKKSEPLLSYSSLGPVYVSPNITVGEKEAAIFFPEGYGEPESEPESETDIEGLMSLRASKVESAEGVARSEEEEGEKDLEGEGGIYDDDMDIFGGMGMDIGMPKLSVPEEDADTQPAEFGGAEAGLQAKSVTAPGKSVTAPPGKSVTAPPGEGLGEGELPGEGEGEPMAAKSVTAPPGKSVTAPPGKSVTAPPGEPLGEGEGEVPGEGGPMAAPAQAKAVSIAEPPVQGKTVSIVEPPAEPSTEPPGEPSAEAPAEAPAAPPAEPPADAPAEPPAEAPAEPPAEAPAEPPAEPPAEAPAEAPAEPPAEAPAEPPAEAPAEPPAPEEPPADEPEE